MNEFEKMMEEIDEFNKEMRKSIIINIVDNRMDFFKSIISEFCGLGEKYRNSYEELKEKVNNNAFSSEYCSQSKCLHRGFYCPSPIIDIIVGGSKRGKLIKKTIKSSKDYYEYIFNESHKLILSKQFMSGDFDFSPYITEFVIYENNIEYGLSFHNGWNEITYISKSVYINNLIQSYSAANYSTAISEEKMDLHYEEYKYENELLTDSTVYFNISPLMNLYDKNEILFRYNVHGEMVEYTIESEYQGNPVVNTFQV